MKNLLLLLPLFAAAVGLSSCCCPGGTDSYEETYRVQTGYETVQEERVVDAKSGLVETIEKKVPQYTEKTRTVKEECPDCARFYCLDDGCCGSDTTAARKMATAQPATGSPHIGLIPTMKSIVDED